MSPEKEHEGFQKIQREFAGLNRRGLYRESLATSQRTQLEPLVNWLESRLPLLVKFGNVTLGDVAGTVYKSYEMAVRRLKIYSTVGEEEYVTDGGPIVAELRTRIKEILAEMPHFIAAAMLETDFLTQEDLGAQLSIAKQELQSAHHEYLADLRNQQDAAVHEVSIRSEELVVEAKKTALGESVKDAQLQFERARKHFKRRIRYWGILSIVSIVALLGAAVGAYFLPLKEGADWPQATHSLVIRITVLSTLGALATFTLRTLRAYMHMFQSNLHRRRIVNSISAFVASAYEKDSRDRILLELVATVADFGVSGLIPGKHAGVAVPSLNVGQVAREISKGL